MKTKIKSDGDEVTDFYDKKIHKVESNQTRLVVISLEILLSKKMWIILPKFFKMSVNTLKKK